LDSGFSGSEVDGVNGFVSGFLVVSAGFATEAGPFTTDFGGMFFGIARIYQ
jgi:hypothetical protein